MTRREDHQTTTPEAAHRFEAHHAIEPLPADHGITAADVFARTFDDHDLCCGGQLDLCWGVRWLRGEGA